jgi:Signal transduction histidine kinase
MIILPIILTFVMGGILSFVIMSIAGINPHSMEYDRIKFEKVNAVQIASNDETYTLITDDAKIYQIKNGGYVVVLPDDANISYNTYDMQGYYISILFILFLIAIVYFTNRALTRYVFRGIITPLETLVNGVHEIRDGNLSYRIAYVQRDEFSVVCSDFNEMAQRLSDMVTRQQKEESSRRELIAGISHDLRTPLTSIKAYIEGLEKGVATSPQKKEKYLDTIKSKADDLEYIINQLFLFSKHDIGDFPFRMEMVDIGRELDLFIKNHENEYNEKGLSIIPTEKIENVSVEIDVVQFRNVLHNILDNSVKYKNKELVEAKIICQKDGANVSIRISDNGTGVSEETLTKIFDVFYRGDISRNNPSKGSGLGLAISKKIVERLGGSINAENAESGGLIIEIILPVSKQEAKNE